MGSGPRGTVWHRFFIFQIHLYLLFEPLNLFKVKFLKNNCMRASISREMKQVYFSRSFPLNRTKTPEHYIYKANIRGPKGGEKKATSQRPRDLRTMLGGVPWFPCCCVHPKPYTETQKKALRHICSLKPKDEEMAVWQDRNFQTLTALPQPKATEILQPWFPSPANTEQGAWTHTLARP